MTEIITDGDGLRNRSDSIKALSVNSDSCNDSCLGYSEVEEDEPPLDQKHLNLVHEELEKLNIATDVINKLEVQLDGARAQFRDIHSSWSEKLKDLSKKYGSTIAKARPYYEAKIQERKVRDASQKSAIRFERATSLLEVAKKQVSLTQESLNRQKIIQPDCLEVLNHHIERVSTAEKERVAAEEEHRNNSAKMLEMAEQIKKMEKEHRSAIKKSRTYFDERLEFTRVLERQKDLILRLEAEVRQKKCDYTTSLRNLERISDSIHEQRSLGGGSNIVKADLPANPPPYLPTAPPPYEDDGRYNFDQVKDDMIDPVLCMISEDQCAEWSAPRPRSLGSGMILLAQQLMGGGEKIEQPLLLVPSQTDISYRTRPEGIGSSPDSSDVSSLASLRTSEPDEDMLNGMIRSHSTLIQEIESSVDRLGHMLRRSVSDVDQESGVESSSGSL